MTTLWDFLLRHGYGLLFAAVLVEQLGAPVPAVPALLVMGALATLGHYSLSIALLVAVTAALAADLVWYQLGRKRGDSVLGFLCRLSLEQDSCVKQTSDRFERWGPATLLIAKFIPGLSTVAPPLAGSAGIAPWRFIVYDAAGSIVWAGAALTLGRIFRHQLEHLIEWLPRLGSGLLLTLAAPLAAWIAWKFWQRERAMRLYRIGRISPDELRSRIDSNLDTWIVDLRSRRSIERSGAKLPGALILDGDNLDVHLKDLPPGAHLVFYCT